MSNAFIRAPILLLAACQSVGPSWDLPTGVKTLQANNYPMAYLERGAGSTVVLVHGALNDYRYWDPQVSSLSSRFRLIAVSLRHYYPERWNGKGDDFSIKLHSDDLAAFIERLGLGPVHLVAHSRGGTVALGTAQSRPDLVRKLVLMDPALFSLLPKPSGTPTTDPRVARAKATAARFEKGDVEGGLEYFIDDVNGPGTWKRRTEEQRQFARDNAWTPIGQLNDVETVTCAQIGGLRMPVLLVGGEKSPRPFVNMLGAFEKCLGPVQRIAVSNAGHQMNRENAAAFDEVLSKFLLE